MSKMLFQRRLIKQESIYSTCKLIIPLFFNYRRSSFYTSVRLTLDRGLFLFHYLTQRRGTVRIFGFPTHQFYFIYAKRSLHGKNGMELFTLLMCLAIGWIGIKSTEFFHFCAQRKSEINFRKTYPLFFVCIALYQVF